MVIQFDDVPAPAEEVWFDPGSDEKLIRLLVKTAGDVGAQITGEPIEGSPAADVLSENVPTLSLQFAADEDLIIQTQTEEAIARVGKMISLALIQMVRQVNY
jgi:hypothetical protein